MQNQVVSVNHLHPQPQPLTVGEYKNNVTTLKVISDSDVNLILNKCHLFKPNKQPHTFKQNSNINNVIRKTRH